ncbi:hypothetical protein [Pedobacter caeni]|uniref:Uncharacterized protein n=1 Tax=Pedobacter caeni TaxID=288992 RepID=A0A1M5PZX0_9SPHI|nr:hypothetical protein [Pedobacter caeni]SHH07240.1 hypothetical protein SAMN04488522_1125 [Pedobacter caeni]
MEEEITSGEITRTPAKFAGNFSVLLQLKPPHFSRDYEVMIVFSEGMNELNLKYQLKVTYVKTLEKARIFRLERLSPVYINEDLPDVLLDQLALETAQVFYPLLLEVDFDGKFLSVHNHQEIVGRWPELKEKVKEYFVGPVTERYLDLMEKGILDQDTVSERFKNDLFIRTYFAAIYKSYGVDYRLEEQVFFPMNEEPDPPSFLCRQEVDPYLNVDGDLEIHHHGNLELADFEGDYKADYVLDAGTRSIERIHACWNLKKEQLKSTDIMVFRTDPKAPVQEEAAENQHLSSLVYLDGEVKQKRGILGSLFRR